MMQTIAIIGPHGSGKTTLGVLAARKLGWEFAPEIGRILREKALREDGGAHAQIPQETFDRQVFRLENLRDRAAAGPRIVETWHPGNLAYARERSRKVFDAYWPVCKKHLARQSGVAVQPLTISPQCLRERLTEPGPDDLDAYARWFHQIGESATSLAGKLGVAVLPPVCTENRSIADALEEMLDNISAAEKYFL